VTNHGHHLQPASLQPEALHQRARVILPTCIAPEQVMRTK
jgi:hypothetical protein